ncbi:HPt (histidine-containing phosphotransfer) domain-containing protein [Catalinimonas alkaloidigena]|uniref:Hpt domain-containing protein n=1 Tax=Catalinimonas alkaloidigena TaxID=1075417 RepID=UPI0024049CD7|nr:Hpt domain-containing protein [Catalinimonas alkaloidigena]MDF9798396.1 HPt (histidine-containing phosphotransfer) domain-containing protein [Catalinimonas alkaloidigena]
MSQETPQKLIHETEQVDLTFLHSLSDGDLEFIHEMVSAFMSEIPETIALFEQHLQNKEWYAIGTLAHKIKPSIQTMGLNSTYELMKIVEVSGKKQERIEMLPTYVGQITQTLQQAIPLLQYELDHKFPGLNSEL